MNTPDPPRVFQAGDIFRQQLEVLHLLGEGASGQVYAVRHLHTGERWALKVMHLAQKGNPREVQRALELAKAVYFIRHANVVEVDDIGCEPDGLVWQRMELLDGSTIADLLRRVGRISPVYAIDIVVEIAHGLQAAHEQGLVHRDVTPANVFLTTAGRVKVLDFSMASWIHGELKTTSGRGPRGTIGYMSPEHLHKAAPTRQFDIYALAIVFWEMVAGRHPFAKHLGNTARMVQCHLQEPLPSLAEAANVPLYVDEVVRTAAAKNPASRHPDMWAFAQALLDLRERLLADERAESWIRDGEPWERARPVLKGTESALLYRSLPAPPPVSAPHLPSARVYVPKTEALPSRFTVAPTVALPVMAAPLETNRTPMSVAAPATVRPGRARSRASWIGLVVSVPVLLATGFGIWALGGAGRASPGARPPPPSTASSPPPRASSSAPPANPHRRPASRPAR